MRRQNGAERADARLCSATAHGPRADHVTGSGASGGAMRASGVNLTVGPAPLVRWALRGAVRDDSTVSGLDRTALCPPRRTKCGAVRPILEDKVRCGQAHPPVSSRAGDSLTRPGGWGAQVLGRFGTGIHV